MKKKYQEPHLFILDTYGLDVLLQSSGLELYDDDYDNFGREWLS